MTDTLEEHAEDLEQDVGFYDSTEECLEALENWTETHDIKQAKKRLREMWETEQRKRRLAMLVERIFPPGAVIEVSPSKVTSPQTEIFLKQLGWPLDRIQQLEDNGVEINKIDSKVALDEEGGDSWLVIEVTLPDGF